MESMNDLWEFMSSNPYDNLKLIKESFHYAAVKVKQDIVTRGAAHGLEHTCSH